MLFVFHRLSMSMLCVISFSSFPVMIARVDLTDKLHVNIKGRVTYESTGPEEMARPGVMNIVISSGTVR